MSEKSYHFCQKVISFGTFERELVHTFAHKYAHFGVKMGLKWGHFECNLPINVATQKALRPVLYCEAT